MPVVPNFDSITNLVNSGAHTTSNLYSVNSGESGRGGKLPWRGSASSSSSGRQVVVVTEKRENVSDFLPWHGHMLRGLPLHTRDGEEPSS